MRAALLALTICSVAAYDLAGLGERVDNEYVRTLEADPEQEQHAPNRSPREVAGGHFVLVQPTAIRSPQLVTYSKEVCSGLLGLDDEACRSNVFRRLFSGSHVGDEIPGFGTSWATPYALSIYGQETVPNGAGPRGYGYGDGRAISIAEVLVEGANASAVSTHWELQLKGSGKTPFCRGSDGRAVLRSSLREFVASEAMAALGVPTTRALSLVVSADESVQRPWYRNASAAIAIGAHRPQQHPGGDLMRSERVAITTRVARSFLRTGQFELYGRRARRREADGLRQLEKLARHALRREYPQEAEADPAAPLQPQLLAMARAASRRFAFLAAEWVRVGYTQSNFNADNNLIGGATLDYGPFGFIERFDPSWGMWIGAGQHFSFMNQPQAAGKNFKQFVGSLEPLLDSDGVKELRAIAGPGYESASRDALAAMWAAKLGLPPSASERAPALWDGLTVLMRASTTDWTLFWRQLAHVAEAAADGAADAELLRLLEPAFYAQSPSDEHAPSATRVQWVQWLRRWMAELEAAAAAAKAAAAEAAAAVEAAPEAYAVASAGERMRRANPKYVPREWMLVEAYSAAERGDYAPLHALLHVLTTPYDEHTAQTASRFYQRAPAGSEQQGGLGFMS